jgi:hypothetical protein
MFDLILGLPVHAFVVHVVVVLLPVGALGAAAIAVVPRWRDQFGWVVLGVLAAALVSVPVAMQSGYSLRDRLGATGVVAEQIENHRGYAVLVLYPAIALLVLTTALFFLHRAGRTDVLMKVVAGLTVVAALAATVQVGIAGHLGSTAVWSCTVGADACKQ